MDSRVLIFRNLLNGVPAWQVARDFQTTESQVNAIFSFVLRKIKSYVFLRKRPMVVATTVNDAKKYRLTCLSILPNLNLEKEPQFKDIHNEIVNKDNAMTVARNLNA